MWNNLTIQKKTKENLLLRLKSSQFVCFIFFGKETHFMKKQ